MHAQRLAHRHAALRPSWCRPLHCAGGEALSKAGALLRSHSPDTPQERRERLRKATCEGLRVAPSSRGEAAESTSHAR